MLRAATILCCLAVAVGAASAHAATTSKLDVVTFSGTKDRFNNYDFTNRGFAAAQDHTAVDWPVNLLFWNNANINKVKSRLGGEGYDFFTNSKMYGRINDGHAWWVDGDRGRKNVLCSGAPFLSDTDEHYRIYADGNDYLSSYRVTLGFYALATSHRDIHECGGSPKVFGYSETAERLISGAARKVWGTNAVERNYASFGNQEDERQMGDHYWQSDGRATRIRVR